MQNTFRILAVLFVIPFIFLIHACKKDGAINSTVTDIEGNLYKTVKIGGYTWMAENLRTTKNNDGKVIPLVTDGVEWGALSTPGYCWYNNDEATYKDTYGALYNLYTVNAGRLCPTGWHVPSNDEWTNLTTYLGGLEIAGSKLKETGTTHWVSPNTGATNESGFTALPSGGRTFYPNLGYMTYNGIGEGGTFWSSSVDVDGKVFFRSVVNYLNNVFSNTCNKNNGLSVRCIKDN